MPKTHEWSPTSRGKALGLRADQRNSLQDISNIINIPKSTVYDINKRGTGITKPRPGRPRKISSRDVHQYIRYLRTNKFTRRTSLSQLKKIFNLDAHECDVSATFMSNRREFDVQLEKINLTRCYEVRLMTVAMVTAVTLQPPHLKRLSPSLKKE